jgi:U3 small nucleolar RNA-associated protein 5
MLGSLSDNGHQLIVVGKDNRVCLWDLSTRTRKRVYVEKHHLSHEYICLSWHRGKKDLGTLGVGCSDGTVIIWDLVRGVVTRVIGEVDKSDVPSDIAFSHDGKTLFVSSASSALINEYSLETGELKKSWKGHKKGVQCLASNSKASVIAVGGSNIKLLDTGSDAKKKKLEGHFSGGVAAQAFSTCGCYLACAGIASREVLVYDVRASAKADPIHVLPVKDSVSSLSVRSTDGCIDVMCCYAGAQAGGCYMRTSSNAKTQTVQITGEVIAISHQHEEVRLAVGSAIKPTVHTIDATDLEQKTINVQPEPEEVEYNNEDSSEQVVPPSVLGPNEFGGVKRPRVEESMTSAETDAKRIRLEGNDGSEDDEEQALTMEQRLSRLGEELTQLHSSSPVDESHTTPTSDSLVTLIDQALQTGDDALLEQCFACDDADVVEATTRRLPSGRIVLLMRRLVSKFEKRPSRGLLLTRWLASLLRHHTAYLVTVPDLTAQLAGLSQMLEQRLSSYARLSTLGGRLDLLLSRMSSTSVGHKVDTQPRNVVREA